MYLVLIYIIILFSLLIVSNKNVEGLSNKSDKDTHIYEQYLTEYNKYKSVMRTDNIYSNRISELLKNNKEKGNNDDKEIDNKDNKNIKSKKTTCCNRSSLDIINPVLVGEMNVNTIRHELEYDKITSKLFNMFAINKSYYDYMEDSPRIYETLIGSMKNFENPGSLNP